MKRRSLVKVPVMKKRNRIYRKELVLAFLLLTATARKFEHPIFQFNSNLTAWAGTGFQLRIGKAYVISSAKNLQANVVVRLRPPTQFVQRRTDTEVERRRAAMMTKTATTATRSRRSDVK
ncbi:hypothetical protein Q3G72_009735 [Acer saccharum]|nr:hypothetical protein Q3G72_009735 [Acer saccharum]